ncbi:MAG: hypothetical protein GXP28_06750 [Planctomycetes bacterium]|nr:hypothetical protein [Planctomycetota bacterium]
MKLKTLTKNLKMSAAMLSCLGMFVAPVAAAPPAAAPRDVALHQGGVLLGQVVDAHGASLAKTPVSLVSGGKEVARTQTDHTGKFTVSGLKGGVYQVASANHQGTYRLWSPQTAPPAAGRGIMLVSGKDVVRGQGVSGPFGGVANWIAKHPIMTAGVVAAGIALPIALDDDDDPPATP